MYYTAVKVDGNGCVARASSTDLMNWKDERIAYGFSSWNQCESSNVQQMDDGRWRLFFEGHHAWSYVDSDNPLRWPDIAPAPIRDDVTGMEVIRRQGDRWLVAYFGLADYRMQVGLLDWSLSNPTIVQIVEAAGLKEFGL